MARQDKAGEAIAFLLARRGVAGESRLGVAGIGKAGKARQDLAGRGKARRDKSRQARHDTGKINN